jgi:MbtH protein
MPSDELDRGPAAVREYAVVVNHEQQYSIWPVDRPPPPGWQPAGFRGSEDEVLRYVEAVWTDLRPLSVRQAIGAPAHPDTTSGE